MTEFRDAIAALTDERYDGCSPRHRADDILAMPEMRAIRLALRRMALDMSDLRPTLEYYGLPEHVLAWVLDDQEAQP